MGGCGNPANPLNWGCYAGQAASAVGNAIIGTWNWTVSTFKAVSSDAWNVLVAGPATTAWNDAVGWYNSVLNWAVNEALGAVLTFFLTLFAAALAAIGAVIIAIVDSTSGVFYALGEWVVSEIAPASPAAPLLLTIVLAAMATGIFLVIWLVFVIAIAGSKTAFNLL